jgi:hypothetical protein
VAADPSIAASCWNRRAQTQSRHLGLALASFRFLGASHRVSLRNYAAGSHGRVEAMASTVPPKRGGIRNGQRRWRFWLMWRSSIRVLSGESRCSWPIKMGNLPGRWLPVEVQGECQHQRPGECRAGCVGAVSTLMSMTRQAGGSRCLLLLFDQMMVFRSSFAGCHPKFGLRAKSGRNPTFPSHSSMEGGPEHTFSSPIYHLAGRFWKFLQQ